MSMLAYDVEIQRQITHRMMTSAAYVGSSNGRLEYIGVAPPLSAAGFDATGRRLTRRK